MDSTTATILTAVERQLTRYFSAMSQQAELAKRVAEQTREDLRNELATRLPALQSAIDDHGAALAGHRGLVESQRVANEEYQQALQAALEERLAEFANHQHWRMNDLEDKIAAVRGVDAETMIEIRQVVRDDMEKAFNGVNSRLDDFAVAHKRFDEQSGALVHHVNETITNLSNRMDEGDQQIAAAVDDRIATFETEIGASLESFAGQVNEHANTLLSKLESSETRSIDRLLELEARTREEQGTKIANVEATIGRVGSGFDDAMIAVNQRLLGVENQMYDFDERVGEMAERLARVDENVLEDVRKEMSAAIGEATLVRIELDRVREEINGKIDLQIVRMSEIEGMLTDTMDVSTAVQLERLDELERQMQLIEPSKVASTGRSAPAAASPGTPPDSGNRAAPPSMSLNPRLPGADTQAHDDEARETEPSFSSH